MGMMVMNDAYVRSYYNVGWMVDRLICEAAKGLVQKIRWEGIRATASYP